MNKVIGIGLPRTGTLSLMEALNKLDIRTIHYPRYSNRFWDNMKNYDGYTDMTTACMFKILDKFFPNSKFVYTVRKMNGWLDSCRSRFDDVQMKKFNEIHLGPFRYFFDCIVFNEKKWRKGYIKHDNDVRKYFKNRKEDLLIYKLCGGDGWIPLCNFLNKEVPNRSFPHTNKRKL